MQHTQARGRVFCIFVVDLSRSRRAWRAWGLRGDGKVVLVWGCRGVNHAFSLSLNSPSEGHPASEL